MLNLSSLHPVVAGLYFLSVIAITMFSASPVFAVVALLGSVSYFVITAKKLRFFREFGFYILLFAVVSVTNPLFSHNGATVLFFFNNNPVTLESLLYGMNIAAILVAVVFWFRCFNFVFTEDKLLLLFGKLSPKIALLISSALRFIPLFKLQSSKIRQSQKAMGLFASDSWLDKLRSHMRVYSSLITWALENAIDTGSSMRARGYGLKGRTHFSLFTFRRTDAVFLAILVVLDSIVISVMALGELDFSFYPVILFKDPNALNISAIIAFTALSLLPFILEVKEGLQWKFYKSKI